jgi:hypothetical protein
MKCEDIRARFNAVKSARNTVQQTWARIEEFIAPYRGRFFEDSRSEGGVKWTYETVRDSTALESNKLLASNLNGNLTSPVVQWFDVGFRDQNMATDADAKQWLEECSRSVWIELQESAFNLHMAEAYEDLTSYGTTFLLEEYDEKEDRIEFQCVPLIEAYFEADAQNRIHTFYRQKKMTPLQMIDKFGDDVPDDIKDAALIPSQAEAKEDVIFCIFKRPGIVDDGQPKAPELRPIGFKWIRLKDATLLGTEGGYFEMPVFVGRWSTVPESIWGVGPSHAALPDVLEINELIRLRARALSKDIDPPILTTERGLLGDLDLDPGGLSVVRSLDEIRPLTSGANYPAVNGAITELRQAIREMYYVNRLDLKESPAMTATEVNARIQQMQKLIGPTLGRLQSDLLAPLIERTFRIMTRVGKLPPMPEVLTQGNQPDLDIEFIGSLPMTQRMDTVSSIQDFIAFVMNSAQMDPAALDRLDIDGAIKAYHDARGTPATAIKSDQAVKVIRENRAKQQAAEQMMQEQATEASTLKDAASGITQMSEVMQ